jgi:hypothetical protein
MSFIDYAKLSFGDIYEVDIHILRAKKQHILILSKLHSRDVFTCEGAQIILLYEDTVVSPPNP